jgi:hypothetical protein
MHSTALLSCVLAVVAGARADTVTMTSGREVECVVLQESAEAVTVRQGYGVLRLPRAYVKSVRKAPTITTIPSRTSPRVTQRIPAFSQVLAAVLTRPWATNLQPIPATVIDQGVLRHVPYQSYRCGEDYEVNIYGDPDNPAGIEIGIYRRLLHDQSARKYCIDVIASALADPVDAAIVRAVRLDEDKVVRGSVTIEITPPTAEDAYGGWWVSVYDESALDRARATEAELADITVARTDVAPARLADSAPEPSRSRPGQSPPPKRGSTPSPATKPANPADDEPSLDWQANDLARARPAVQSSPGGGSVYVRGYYRKNGTYVRPHTRSRRSR